MSKKLRKRTGRAHSNDAEVAVRDDRPETPDDLHAWIRRVLGVDVARTNVCEDNAAPFDYVCHAYFEGHVPGREPGRSADCVVWASRGGGKTFLGALATLLDLVFKPGVQVRILGGSLEQSRRMYEHLRGFLDKPGIAEMVDGRPTMRRVRLNTGSVAEVLAASQTSVRGTRVQKLRCDEVDLFDPEVWQAAQLTTRSMTCKGPWGERVRGSVEALSTMHKPYGLMWELVGARLLNLPGLREQDTPTRRIGAWSRGERPVFRWGVLDVLEKCGDEHACPSCELWPECQGRAKGAQAGGGHLSVSDARIMKTRVDHGTWAAEMLCQRPRRTDAVYPEFDPQTHVFADDAGGAGRRFFAGMDFGFRSEAVLLLASLDDRGVLRVEREHAAKGQRLEEHIDVLRSWVNDGLAGRTSGEDLMWVGVDPAGRARSDQSGRSNVELIRRAGFEVKFRAGAIHAGVRLVRARLAPAAWTPTMPTLATRGGLSLTAAAANPAGPRPPEHTGARPTLFVHARCERLIECLQRYHYPSDKPEATDPAKDGVDHACDALRYLVVCLEPAGKVNVGRM